LLALARTEESFRFRQISASWSLCSRHLSCAYMKKIYNTAQKRFLRGWVKQLFSSWIKRQNYNYEKDFETVIEKLQDIEESIEIIAREIYRQSKKSKQ
jgi:hypothetical protein